MLGGQLTNQLKERLTVDQIPQILFLSQIEEQQMVLMEAAAVVVEHILGI